MRKLLIGLLALGSISSFAGEWMTARYEGGYIHKKSDFNEVCNLLTNGQMPYAESVLIGGTTPRNIKVYRIEKESIKVKAYKNPLRNHIFGGVSLKTVHDIKCSETEIKVGVFGQTGRPERQASY